MIVCVLVYIYVYYYNIFYSCLLIVCAIVLDNRRLFRTGYRRKKKEKRKQQQNQQQQEYNGPGKKCESHTEFGTEIQLMYIILYYYYENRSKFVLYSRNTSGELMKSFIKSIGLDY